MRIPTGKGVTHYQPSVPNLFNAYLFLNLLGWGRYSSLLSDIDPYPPSLQLLVPS